jgi:hypothetical protein
MSRFLKHLGVLLCGIFTSFAVALGVSLIQQHTDHDVFNFTYFYLVPVGAILCGCLAATGFYAASLYFHIRASFSLLVQMLIVIGCAQTFIYWMDYQTALFGDGGLVHEALGFFDYFQITQTMARYKIGRLVHDTGEVGLWGYAIVLLKFLGFAGGNVVVYTMLRASLICEPCAQYMKELKRKYHVFKDSDAFATYCEGLFSHDLHAPEFGAALAHIQDEKALEGSCKITHTLYGCPKCRAQLLTQESAVYDGKDWRKIEDLSRTLAVPQNANLLTPLQKSA